MSRIKQDVPPQGGFPPIRIRKSPGYAKKFWSGGTLVLVTAIGMTWGYYRVWLGMNKEKALSEEDQILQTAVKPFLQAERDIAYTVQHRAFMKKVQKLTADQSDFDVNEKFYNSEKRHIKPLFDVDIAQFKNTRLA